MTHKEIAIESSKSLRQTFYMAICIHLEDTKLCCTTRSPRIVLLAKERMAWCSGKMTRESQHSFECLKNGEYSHAIEYQSWVGGLNYRQLLQ